MCGVDGQREMNARALTYPTQLPFRCIFAMPGCDAVRQGNMQRRVCVCVTTQLLREKSFKSWLRRRTKATEGGIIAWEVRTKKNRTTCASHIYLRA